MTKTYSAQKLSAAATRHRVVWTDVPYGDRKHIRRKEFLRELLDQDLLRCGPVEFDILKEVDNGDAWVVILEAEEVVSG